MQTEEATRRLCWGGGEGCWLLPLRLLCALWLGWGGGDAVGAGACDVAASVTSRRVRGQGRALRICGAWVGAALKGRAPEEAPPTRSAGAGGGEEARGPPPSTPRPHWPLHLFWHKTAALSVYPGVLRNPRNLRALPQGERGCPCAHANSHTPHDSQLQGVWSQVRGGTVCGWHPPSGRTLLRDQGPPLLRSHL